MNEDLLSIATDIVDQARRYGADEADAIRHLLHGVVRAGAARGGRAHHRRRLARGRHPRDQGQAHGHLLDRRPDAGRAGPDGARHRRAGVDLGAGRVRRACRTAPTSPPAPLPNLQLYDERIESLTTDEMRDMALRMEAAAFDYDKRVTNSDGAEMERHADGRGAGEQPRLRRHLPRHRTPHCRSRRSATTPTARSATTTGTRFERALHRLESPEEVGRKAAARAVAKLGARKVATTAVPVVWEAPVARRPAAHRRPGRLRRGALPALDLPRRPRRPAGRVAAVHARPTTRCCRDASARGLSTAKACARGRVPLFEGGRLPHLPLRQLQRPPARRGAPPARPTAASPSAPSPGTTNLVMAAGHADAARHSTPASTRGCCSPTSWASA